jgi:hypothetical protein
MLFYSRQTKRLAGFRALRLLYRESRCGGTPETRGLRLLRAWLSNEQRAQFDSRGYFDVVGCESGKKYRIHVGVSVNVRELDCNEIEIVGWCFVPRGSLVPGDVMLAQKIALETAEYDALAIANRLPIPAGRALQIP